MIDVWEKASFEILRREDQLEAARLDGILTAVLHAPDLRVGDELEFAATLRTTARRWAARTPSCSFSGRSRRPAGSTCG
ncbi:hypothetical protein [Novosphingobium sp. BL-52-GroH]|uniref:hypothetical protein n=1 Tax=Novosphingobium sp. BL-52-GroH TaxID=3349877 RepID=UPI00384E07CA